MNRMNLHFPEDEQYFPLEQIRLRLGIDNFMSQGGLYNLIRYNASIEPLKRKDKTGLKTFYPIYKVLFFLEAHAQENCSKGKWDQILQKLKIIEETLEIQPETEPLEIPNYPIKKNVTRDCRILLNNTINRLTEGKTLDDFISQRNHELEKCLDQPGTRNKSIETYVADSIQKGENINQTMAVEFLLGDFSLPNRDQKTSNEFFEKLLRSRLFIKAIRKGNMYDPQLLKKIIALDGYVKAIAYKLGDQLNEEAGKIKEISKLIEKRKGFKEAEYYDNAQIIYDSFVGREYDGSGLKDHVTNMSYAINNSLLVDEETVKKYFFSNMGLSEDESTKLFESLINNMKPLQQSLSVSQENKQKEHDHDSQKRYYNPFTIVEITLQQYFESTLSRYMEKLNIVENGPSIDMQDTWNYLSTISQRAG